MVRLGTRYPGLITRNALLVIGSRVRLVVAVADGIAPGTPPQQTTTTTTCRSFSFYLSLSLSLTLSLFSCASFDLFHHYHYHQQMAKIDLFTFQIKQQTTSRANRNKKETRHLRKPLPTVGNEPSSKLAQAFRLARLIRLRSIRPPLSPFLSNLPTLSKRKIRQQTI